MRWADLDMLGHVNNVTYVDYLQEARVDMLRFHSTHGHGQADLAEGVVVVRHEVTYLRPLLFTFDAVRIECWVTEIRAASFTLAYEIFRESASRPGKRTVFARATTVLTPFVFAEERPRRITPEERARLEVFLEPGDRTRAPRSEPVPRTDLGHFPVHVRFSDVDVYGHVNNVKYFEYFQEGRIALMSRLWESQPGDAPYPGMVVAQTNVDYRVPLLFRHETYDLWSEVTRVGRTSVTLDSEISDGDAVCSRATVTLVFWDPATGHPAEIPDGFRAALLATTQ